MFIELNDLALLFHVVFMADFCESEIATVYTVLFYVSSLLN